MAAGCIIYIKQMDETEDEINHYRILRRIGFTNTDMIKGLALKIIFNFGLPLVVSFTPCLLQNAFMMLIGNYIDTYLHCHGYLFTCISDICSYFVHSFRTHH